MRDNILTLGYRAQHPIKYHLIRIGATLLVVLLSPLIIIYLSYITYRFKKYGDIII